MPDNTLKRLHVTPLSPELLETILNPSVRTLATDVSFHSIQTFPENNYGYITLPSVEADKLAKKLNGSILKGKKFKIQEAMPKKRLADESSVEDSTRKRSKREEPSKKRKTKEETVPGYELPTDRKVKRGWTEDPAETKRARKGDKSKNKKDEKKKRSQRSKYTEHQECLFRTVPPPNKTPDDGKGEKREKKSKRTRDTVVVHEFAKTTTHPTFLRTNDSGSKDDMTSEYVEDKGWIDRAGKVKEPPVPKKEKKRSIPSGKSAALPGKSNSTNQKSQASAAASTDEVDSDWTSSSGSSLDSSNDSDTSESEKEDAPGPELSSAESDSEETSSKPSSESDNNDSETSDAKNAKVDGMPDDRKRGSQGQPSIQEDSDGDQDMDPSTPKASEPKADTEVHPLEALFKQPAQSAAPKPASDGNAQFSFFGNNDDEDDVDGDENNHIIQHPAEPQTPFTKQDMKRRVIRSGAPTPDTAAVNRRKIFDEDDDDEDEEMEVSPQPASTDKKQTAVEESDFAKWFWENRGDNNRAWKRRRREAAKEKRQKDNRRRGLRGR